MGSQITSLTIVYSAVHSCGDQSSESLAFVQGIHRWPMNSPHKWPVTRKMFQFGDAIMWYHLAADGLVTLGTWIITGHAIAILNCFTRYKCIVIQKDSWINIHEWFGCNFPTWNIRNVWRARDDGYHYDVTSKCCCVTITTRLVEWTLSISKIRVFFCCFQELSGLQMVTQIKCGIKAKRHGRSVSRN